MSEIDLAPLHTLLSELPSQDRPALLPTLHAAQAIYGYLPEPAVRHIAEALNVPLADVHGVIEFYHMFYRYPAGRTVVQVCTDAACMLAGSEEIMAAALKVAGASEDEISPDGSCTVRRTSCLGLCEHAPAVMVGNVPQNSLPVGHVCPDDAPALCRGDLLATGCAVTPTTVIGGTARQLTANCGHGRTDLDAYHAAGGYTGLKRALGFSPAEVIAEVKAAGLVGRGGAAFPTGVKWEGAANTPAPRRYVACNADESEPGTFKDRVLMEDDPHRILEGMIIAAWAVQANHGYLYVRGEYPYAYASMEKAVQEAYAAKIIGPNVLGTGFSFDIEMHRGAGAYICGEETALFESIEGKRGYPRLKPPFPTTHGLFGMPTVINNVETLCNVPWILEHGAQMYRRHGTEKSPGTKLFCLSGDVRQPGLYEAPFGITMRQLIYGLAGGMRGDHDLQAVLVGGAAGVFTGPDGLDVPMTFEDLRSAGLALGSGVVMVFDHTRDLRKILVGLARFFTDESCGKCYPCQIGTRRQLEVLRRFADGRPLPGDVERLNDIGWTMTDASICGLGQTAASAVLSALRLLPALFSA